MPAQVSAAAAIRTLTLTAQTNGVPIEHLGPADLRGYVWRIALAGASTAALRRLRWRLEPVDAIGG